MHTESDARVDTRRVEVDSCEWVPHASILITPESRLTRDTWLIGQGRDAMTSKPSWGLERLQELGRGRWGDVATHGLMGLQQF